MSSIAASRGLVAGCSRVGSHPLSRCTISAAQSRSLFGWGKKKDDTAVMSSDDYYRNLLKKPQAATDMTDTPRMGGLSEGSIFDEEASQQTVTAPKRAHTELVLNPNPQGRKRWLRKMTVKAIQRDGQLTRDEIIKRTERESRSRSRFFDTSVKKLGPLARQIAGKSLGEAIVQMQYSKKKASREVYSFLKLAQDQATARHGMGLGNEPAELLQIRNKVKVIRDPTRIYVSEAWVGRGKYTKELECRARGRTNIIRHPSTSISVVLKEEKTRSRLAREKQEKEDGKPVWTQLPDRSIHGQRQYYTW